MGKVCIVCVQDNATQVIFTCLDFVLIKGKSI